MRRITTLAVTSAFLLAGCGSKGPDTTVRELVRDLSTGKASALWHALPARYQKDLLEVRTMLADKLDPEIYDAGALIMRDFVRVLRDRPGLIAELAPGQVSAMTEEHGEVLFDLFENLLSGEIATVAGVRNLDIPRFLDSFGGALFQAVTSIARAKGQDMDQLSTGLQVEVQNHNRGSCVLMIGAANLPAKLPVPFQEVEGKWIPSGLAGNWSRSMAALREKVREMPSMSDPETKERLRVELDEMRKRLDAAKRSTTASEFRAIMASPPKAPR